MDGYGWQQQQHILSGKDSVTLRDFRVALLHSIIPISNQISSPTKLLHLLCLLHLFTLSFLLLTLVLILRASSHSSTPPAQVAMATAAGRLRCTCLLVGMR